MCLNLSELLLFYILVIPYLNEAATVILESKNSIFFCSNWKYLIFFFVFRLNIFTNKISNLLLPLEAEGAWGFESYITIEIFDLIYLWITISHIFVFLSAYHLGVNNIWARGVFNKNRLHKYTIIGDKQLQKKNVATLNSASHIKKKHCVTCVAGVVHVCLNGRCCSSLCMGIVLY